MSLLETHLMSCRLAGSYPVLTHHEVISPPSTFPIALVDLAMWSETFLTNSHPDLGRPGPVCPYTRASIDRDLYFLADTLTSPAAEEDISELMQVAKTWFLGKADETRKELRQHLTLLVPLPWLAAASSHEIDLVQRQLKDAYVTDGLMVGQFHPTSEEAGLWSDTFRPLRTQTPLLAIRYMVPGDIAFLRQSPLHLEAYLKRFAPDIPARARGLLAALAQAA